MSHRKNSLERSWTFHETRTPQKKTTPVSRNSGAVMPVRPRLNVTPSEGSQSNCWVSWRPPCAES